MTATSNDTATTATATVAAGKKLTIYDIKYLYRSKSNYNYFDTKSLKTMGITLKSFRVYKINDRYYMLYIKKYNRIKYYDAVENILIGVDTYNQQRATATVADDTSNDTMKG